MANDSLQYNPYVMDSAINYVDNAKSYCQDAIQIYSRLLNSINVINSAGYSLSTGGVSVLGEITDSLENVKSELIKTKGQFEKQDAAKNDDYNFDLIFDWDGDGKSFEWLDYIPQGYIPGTSMNEYFDPYTIELMNNAMSDFTHSVKDTDYSEIYKNPIILDNGLVLTGEMLEFFTDSDYRSACVEEVLDLDNDGVRDYKEFTQSIRDTDYTEIYTNPIILDNGMVITGEMLNFCKPVVSNSIDLVGDLGTEIVVDPLNVVPSTLNLVGSVFEGASDWIEAVVDTMIVANGYSLSAEQLKLSQQYETLGILTGNDCYSNIASDMREFADIFVPTAAKVAAYDATDTVFDFMYTYTPARLINENAYDIVKRGEGDNNKNGLLYNIGESVGFNLPTLAITHGVNVCGGTGFAKTTIQSLVNWAPSFGKNYESNYAKAVAKSNGDLTLDDIYMTGFKAFNSATVDSLIIYASGKISNLSGTRIGDWNVEELGDDFLNISPIYETYNVWEDIGINKNDVAIAVKSLKPVINELFDTFVYGDEFTEEDAEAVLIEILGVIIAENVSTSFGNHYKKIEPDYLEYSQKSVDSADVIMYAANNNDGVDLTYTFLNDFLKDSFKRVGKEGASVTYKDLTK